MRGCVDAIQVSAYADDYNKMPRSAPVPYALCTLHFALCTFLTQKSCKESVSSQPFNRFYLLLFYALFQNFRDAFRRHVVAVVEKAARTFDDEPIHEILRD